MDFRGFVPREDKTPGAPPILKSARSRTADARRSPETYIEITPRFRTCPALKPEKDGLAEPFVRQITATTPVTKSATATEAGQFQAAG